MTPQTFPPLKGFTRLIALLLAVMLTSGCVSQPAKLSDPVKDPWEPFNRNMYGFNQVVDRAIYKPVAKGYDAVVPSAPRRGISNFFHNLQYPLTFVNLMLQGKVTRAMEATGRFLMNISLGGLGFFDVATKAGIPQYNEDFGQTLAVWGWKNSNYLVVPFLGPFTVRDIGGRGIVGYVSPTAWAIREHNLYAPLILELISIRSSLLQIDQDIAESSDPYLFVRDAYLQNREFEIYDGDPPAPDYDALLEEY